METKFLKMCYKSPECTPLDLQSQTVLCASDPKMNINDFEYFEDVWN